MKSYIKESALAAQKSMNEQSLFGHIQVVVSDRPPDAVSIATVLDMAKKSMPKHLLGDVDAIYIGNFKPLNDRQVDSMYVSGAILISSNHESNEALYSTLVHEFAHAIEEIASDKIYGDGDIEREFLGKRKMLYAMLKDDYSLDKKDFMNTQFTYSFDNLLNKEIGYDNMGVITSDLFLSPYGATSIREYFANAFEHLYTDNPEQVREISPLTYKKIKFIINPKNMY